MQLFLIITFLFFVGSILGWVIELIFRRIVGKKWINPGFLIGPYLPIYGFGLVALFLLSLIDLSFIESNFLSFIVRIILIMFVATLIEYIGGIIFVKGMNIKLWDYSDRKGNIQGIICPLFTLFWGAIGTVYYFLVHPLVLNALNWYLFDNLAFSFFVGIFYGFILIDLVYSLDLSSKIKKIAKENVIVIKYEELKLSIRRQIDEVKGKVHYWHPFQSHLSLKDAINKYKNEKNKNK